MFYSIAHEIRGIKKEGWGQKYDHDAVLLRLRAGGRYWECFGWAW